MKSNIHHGKPFLLRKLCILIFWSWVSSVSSAEQNPDSKENSEWLLGLVGYNYTDREIEDYSIDGVGGGHIRKSSPTSGGGGTTCCVRLLKELNGTIQVKVRWQVDGCRYLIKDLDGNSEAARHFFYREEEVSVTIPPGKTIAYLETHFYPNGRPQVRLTEYSSLPALALDKKRPDRSLFPRCKDDQHPE